MNFSNDIANDWSDRKFLRRFKNIKFKEVGLKTWRSHAISFLNALYSEKFTNYKVFPNLQALILMLPHPKKDELLFENYLDEDRCDSDLVEGIRLLEVIGKMHISSRIFFSIIPNNFEPNTSDHRFISIRIVLGIMALECLKSVVGSHNFKKSFTNQNLKALIKKFYSYIDIPVYLPLPCSAFLNHLKFCCDENHPEMHQLFAFLIGVYTTEMKKNSQQSDSALIELLEITILKETRLNGMEVISLLEKVSNIYELSMIEAISLLYPNKNSETQVEDENENEEDDSINRSSRNKINCKTDNVITCNYTNLKEFYEKFIAKGANEISWPWARLIDENHFYELSFKETDIRMKCIAGLISITEPDIWNMHALKIIPDTEKQSLTEWAHTMHKKFQET